MSSGGSVRTPRVVATPAVLEALADLVDRKGPVLLFQSGGCCDGSLPMCFAQGEFVVSVGDLLLGDVEGCPFYIDSRQFKVWRRTQLILDVADGDPEGFSLAAGDGRHFITRSRTMGPEERVTGAGESQLAR